MNQRQLGRSGLEVSALGFGCMGLKLAKAMGAEVTLFSRKALAGSLIGGIAETQEMLDFCGQHGITSDIEVINIRDINEAYERLLKADVKYRFVIDMASLKEELAA